MSDQSDQPRPSGPGEPSLNARLTHIEEKVAFLERHLEELDEVVRRLYDQHEALAKRVKERHEALADRVESIEEEAGDAGPETSAPPHWGRARPE